MIQIINKFYGRGGEGGRVTDLIFKLNNLKAKISAILKRHIVAVATAVVIPFFLNKIQL
jgi:hypothetical protein